MPNNIYGNHFRNLPEWGEQIYRIKRGTKKTREILPYRCNSACALGLSHRIAKSAAGVVQSLRRPSAEIRPLINLFLTLRHQPCVRNMQLAGNACELLPYKIRAGSFDLIGIRIV